MQDEPNDWMSRDPYEECLASLPECESCEGTGLLDHGHASIDCFDCGGTGRVEPYEDLGDDLEAKLGVEARHDTDGPAFTEDFFDPSEYDIGGES